MEIGILNTQIRPLAALPRQVLGRRSGAGWPQIFYFGFLANYCHGSARLTGWP